ncbi:polyprenyl synthetase family protein [Aquirhabdus sp.]|uniref:polyprenyl synthetase family protein n=1 Tax=Aquirhabdus sp. TaxID=2824160 RepID=UPI00396C7D15
MTDFNSILQPVADDFAAMDHFIKTGINSKVPLVLQVSSYVVEAGGKRMRPLMSLLAARACGFDEIKNEKHGNHNLKLAAIIEMLHTATLVHDDVVDESGLRRGRPTANATWTNATAVLVGDYLIARAFDLLVSLKDLELLHIMSSGTCEIAEGEVLQLQHQHNPDSTEADYLQIIYGKTSRLFMLATEGAALLAHTEHLRVPLKAYGEHFGNAFQIIDDILDYTSDAATLGKNIGDDLAEGKPTLPLIATMQRVHNSDNEMIRRSIQTGGLSDLDKIVHLVKTSGGLEYCQFRAKEETDLAIAALAPLPDSIYKESLINLAKLALSRLN